MTDWRANGKHHIAELRKDPERMVEFAAWVFEETWTAMHEQNTTVTLSVDQVTQRSGFNESFLRLAGFERLPTK